MNFKPAKNQRPACSPGFTLLEIMVSVAIISIVLVGIIRLQGQTISMNETIRFYTVAPILANSKISEIEFKPSEFNLSSSGDFGDEFPGYSWKAEIEEMKIDVMESPELSLKKIDLSISFNEGELNFSIRRYMNADAAGEG